MVVLDVGRHRGPGCDDHRHARAAADDLEQRGVSLSLAQAKGKVRDRLARTGLLDRIASDSLYFSVAQAVALEDDRLAG